MDLLKEAWLYISPTLTVILYVLALPTALFLLAALNSLRFYIKYKKSEYDPLTLDDLLIESSPPNLHFKDSSHTLKTKKIKKDLTEPYGGTNPANGLPMFGLVDTGGNPYGSSN